jgi:hypothetical protein
MLSRYHVVTRQRKVGAVRAKVLTTVTDTVVTIQNRLQQCLCSKCSVMAYDQCTLTVYVGEWKSVQLTHIPILSLYKTLQAAEDPLAAAARFFEGALPTNEPVDEADPPTKNTLVFVGLILVDTVTGLPQFRLGTMIKPPFSSTITDTKTYKDCTGAYEIAVKDKQPVMKIKLFSRQANTDKYYLVKKAKTITIPLVSCLRPANLVANHTRESYVTACPNYLIGPEGTVIVYTVAANIIDEFEKEE